jgi:hypothetical protein
MKVIEAMRKIERSRSPKETETLARRKAFTSSCCRDAVDLAQN